MVVLDKVHLNIQNSEGRAGAGGPTGRTHLSAGATDPGGTGCLFPPAMAVPETAANVVFFQGTGSSPCMHVATQDNEASGLEGVPAPHTMSYPVGDKPPSPNYWTRNKLLCVGNYFNS